MQIEGRVGPAFGQDGVQEPPRLGRTLEVVVGQAHGRYQEANLRGNVFCAANTAAQATSTASSTATGLILTNPVGSGVILSILDCAVGVSAVVPAVFTVGLFSGGPVSTTAVTQTVAITPRNAMIGNGKVGAGLAASSATLPASPVHIRTLLCSTWITGGTSTSMEFAKDEISGAIALLPGTNVSIQSVVGTQSCISSITWEELPYTA